MSDVLQRAKRTYDFVVIDTPPLGVVADVMPLVRIVDGVVIVAQMGHNRRDAAQRLRETLKSVDAHLLGVIANRVKGRGAAYGYDYGYSSNVQTADPIATPVESPREDAISAGIQHGAVPGGPDLHAPRKPKASQGSVRRMLSRLQK
jgi:succinoglycan biosynthesis transport protein ExoP